MFKEPQDWFLPLLEVAACTSAVGMEFILLPSEENKIKKKTNK